MSKFLEKYGFNCVKKGATRQSEVSSHANGPYKVIYTESAVRGDKWKLYCHNALLESGEGRNALSGRLDVLSSDNTKKYMAFLESKRGEDKAVVESVQIEFLKAILESYFERNEAKTGEPAADATIDFVRKYFSAFKHSGIQFGRDSETPNNRRLMLTARRLRENFPIYSIRISSDGSEVAIYQSRGFDKNDKIYDTELLRKNVPIKGSRGSEEWQKNLYNVIMGLFNGTTLGKADQKQASGNADGNRQPQQAAQPAAPVATATPASQAPADNTPTQKEPANTPEYAEPPKATPAPAATAQSNRGASSNQALRKQFSDAIADLFCEKEHTRHPHKDELFLNVGVWLTKDEAEVAKSRGRIVQYNGISSIDNKDGGPELAVIFRGGKAFAFNREGGLAEGGRWKPGKKSSTYTALGEVKDAATFRQLVIDKLGVKTEREVGFTNAQAERGEYTAAAANASETNAKEYISGKDDAKPQGAAGQQKAATTKDTSKTHELATNEKGETYWKPKDAQSGQPAADPTAKPEMSYQSGIGKEERKAIEDSDNLKVVVAAANAKRNVSHLYVGRSIGAKHGTDQTITQNKAYAEAENLARLQNAKDPQRVKTMSFSPAQFGLGGLGPTNVQPEDKIGYYAFVSGV